LLFICSDDDQQARFAERFQSSVTELTSVWHEMGFTGDDLSSRYAKIGNILKHLQTVIDEEMGHRRKTLDAIECSRRAIAQLAQELGHPQPAEVEYTAIISVVLCCTSHFFNACKA